MKSEDMRAFALNIEQLCVTDPAFIGVISSILRSSSPTVVDALLRRQDDRRTETISVFPHLSDIGAAQLSIFDNWPDGRRPSRKRGELGARKIRYKAILDIWTNGTDKLSSGNVSYRAQFNLMDRAERTAALARYRDPTKSKGGFAIVAGQRDPEWEAFDAALSQAPDGVLAGPAQVRGGSGTNYGLHIMAVCNHGLLDARDPALQVVIAAGDQRLWFGHFVDHYAASGRKLMGNAALSCRLANADKHVGWRTGLLSCPIEVPHAISIDDIPY